MFLFATDLLRLIDNLRLKPNRNLQLHGSKKKLKEGI